MPSKNLFTPDEFRMEFCPEIGRTSFYELVRSGRIHSIRIGRRFLIPKSEGQAFLEREAKREP